MMDVTYPGDTEGDNNTWTGLEGQAFFKFSRLAVNAAGVKIAMSLLVGGPPRQRKGLIDEFVGVLGYPDYRNQDFVSPVALDRVSWLVRDEA